jgi:mono/diheme cytochrome c family protein
VQTRRVVSHGSIGWFLALVAFVASGSLATNQERQPKPDSSSGEYLYRTYCASCHGPDGRGDGPAAATFSRPLSDLTTLASRAGGDFPRAEVTRIVDGQQKTTGHTPGDMPKWGRVLRSLEGDDRTVRQQIEAVVKYLELLQRKNDE